MINEQQANTLLNECEYWLDIKLDLIRERLRADHGSTKPILWELIVLHAFANSIVSKCNNNKIIPPQIQHEPTEASPDIILSPTDCQPFCVEVTYTETQEDHQKKEHPIYGVIKNKAKQAKKWNDSKEMNQPLVLIIGVKEGCNQTDKYRRAIYSALADTEGWDLAAIFNLTYDRTICGPRHRYRVPGSKLISAVIVVTFEDHYYMPFTFRTRKKASKPFIIRNPRPNIPLTDSQELLLRQLNFNQMIYGSTAEEWEQINNIKSQSLFYKCLRESEGHFSLFLSLSPHDLLGFGMEMPSKIFANLLLGNIDLDEVWDDFDKKRSSHTSIRQEIGMRFRNLIHLRKALSLPISIINIEFIKEVPNPRKGSHVKFEIGKICTKNNINEDYDEISLNDNTDGSFTVKIPSDFIFSILSGKIKASDGWNHEDRKETGDFLKKAVRIQDIKSIGFVQCDSDSRYESYIVLEFGVAVDRLIREDKKRLKELKKLKKI
jgi:hypothetical protein